MTHRVSIVHESHGYTIRVEETSFSLEGEDKNESVERTKTISTLAIINERETALEVFNTLNTFIEALVKHEILKKDVFRN